MRKRVMSINMILYHLRSTLLSS